MTPLARRCSEPCGGGIVVEAPLESLIGRRSAQWFVLRLTAVRELIRTEFARLQQDHEALKICFHAPDQAKRI